MLASKLSRKKKAPDSSEKGFGDQGEQKRMVEAG